MSAWHTVLQEASFKGVPFDIERIEERNGKALAEHARPFVSGTDLEDMGNNGREVQISAVFWGKQYSSRLLKLLSALEESGPGVLVHPVWGRMQNMMPAAWSYRHEADNVDYAAIDMTFREASEAQPLLVFENSFLMSLERLIGKIDAYRSFGEGFIDSVLAVKSEVSALFGSVWGIHAALAGSFAAVRQLFGFSEAAWPVSGLQAAVFQTAQVQAQQAQTADGYEAQPQTAAALVFEMVEAGLRRAADAGVSESSGGQSVRRRIDAVCLKADEVCALPLDVLAQDRAAQTLKKLLPRHIEPVALLLESAALAALLTISTELLEAHGDTMGAPDLMQVDRTLRRRIQAHIDRLRAMRATAAERAPEAAETALLAQSTHHTTEALRDTAGRLNLFIRAAINQKPPLIVRPAPLDGTVHQASFAFYADITRADELIRLNPHIRHPAFIRRGTLMNCYAK
ncbi:DNA circularization protein [Bergeriella denitrificans]|uniref:Putative phage virion protein n=1 Tax=Bergeriella denitrificans TaxID=494 RepID=A0A378UIM5_BERDE|nr:DNA circularization N-terminal domain-containing protein [Bergeriella denitrificans]STZ76341.1 putative phage virion protein [Bergeriella denitrificans]